MHRASRPITIKNIKNETDQILIMLIIFVDLRIDKASGILGLSVPQRTKTKMCVHIYINCIV